MAVILEQPIPQKGLALVMHGLGGYKEQPHVALMAKALYEVGYTTIRFDTTNTLGESEGNYEDATTTNYYEDLEDVIGWMQQQSWYTEPFILAGHSLGGLCSSLFAQKYPSKVKALAPLGTVISGKLSEESPQYQDGSLKEWKESGWRIRKSTTKPGLIKRLPWSHMEDRLHYDLLPEAHKLTMPILLVTGELDDCCPPAHQKILYDALPGKKELHIIPNAPHTFREPAHLQQLKTIFNAWICRIL